MFHVMEHIPNPVKTFKKLYDLLNENGVLFIEVPNIETYGQSPDNTFFKAHIHYFNGATLTACASQYFDVAVLDDSGNLRILFKKKDNISEFELPTKKQVNNSISIINSKGWFNYIFAGKGYLKAIDRIIIILNDRKLPKITAKKTLDKIISK